MCYNTFYYNQPYARTHAHFQLQMICMRVCLYRTHNFYIFTYLGVQCNIINSECHKPEEDNDSDSKIQTAALDSEPIQTDILLLYLY